MLRLRCRFVFLNLASILLILCAYLYIFDLNETSKTSKVIHTTCYGVVVDR